MKLIKQSCLKLKELPSLREANNAACLSRRRARLYTELMLCNDSRKNTPFTTASDPYRGGIFRSVMVSSTVTQWKSVALQHACFWNTEARHSPIPLKISMQ